MGRWDGECGEVVGYGSRRYKRGEKGREGSWRVEMRVLQDKG